MEFKNLLSSNVKGTVVFHDENKIVVLDEYSSTHTYENVKPCTFYIGTQVKAGDVLGELKENSLHYKVERVGNLALVDEVKLDELTKKYTNVLEKLAEKHDIPSNDILEVGNFDGSEFCMTVDVIEKSKVFELYNDKAEKVLWLGEDGFLYAKNLKLVKLNKDEPTAFDEGEDDVIALCEWLISLENRMKALENNEQTTHVINLTASHLLKYDEWVEALKGRLYKETGTK